MSKPASGTIPPNTRPTCVLDIGRVLRRYSEPTEQSSSSADRPVDGALAAVERLVELFEGRVFLVSAIYSDDGARRSIDWLEAHGFLALVPLEQVIFVSRKSEKAAVCTLLNASHVVDDQLDKVLAYLTDVPHRIWFTGASTSRRDVTPPSWVTECETWTKALQHISNTLKWGWPGNGKR